MIDIDDVIIELTDEDIKFIDSVNAMLSMTETTQKDLENSLQYVFEMINKNKEREIKMNYKKAEDLKVGDQIYLSIQDGIYIDNVVSIELIKGGRVVMLRLREHNNFSGAITLDISDTFFEVCLYENFFVKCYIDLEELKSELECDLERVKNGLDKINKMQNPHNGEAKFSFEKH